eukprot:TRINITY_DN412450_c0_g1_i1.p1 TRINITY_DN412450_c0_g1~~TRINITY_DN412450_c0_g1_i1.p1  ORF type:complete len:127 (-),score=8.96 TRINITY_DN412450_c0_g1_i1:77-457(-)
MPPQSTGAGAAMPKKKKGQTLVCVYPDWCKGCGLCVAFCPGKVLELNALGKADVVRPEECINCGFCELHCPDFAIAVRPKVTKNGVHCRTSCEPGEIGGAGKTSEPCELGESGESDLTPQKAVAEG